MRGFSKLQAVGFLLTGTAVGAIAALLFAPKSGVQMRRDIRKLSRRTMNQLEDFQCDLRDQISEGYEQVKRMIKTA
jgi:gas vesicle protein